MRNSLICIFLSVFGLMACTEADDLTFREGDGVVVNFTTPGLISGEVGVTRADPPVNLAKDVTVRILAYRRVAGATSANIANDTYIGENTYVADADGKLTACVVDANGKKTTGTPTELRLIQGDYDFYAITPAIATKGNLHKEAEVGHGVDYATSLTTKTIAPGAGTVSLNTLDRKCSKLEFNFNRKTTNVTQIDIDEVTLTAMSKAPLTGTLAEDLPAASDITEDMTLGSSVFTVDATDKYKATGSKIVLPKPAGNITIGMKLKFNGLATSVTLAPATVKNLAFAKGTRYVFKVVLKGGSVKLTLTVADWNETYNVNADDLGASNSLTIEVGEWNKVDFNASSGGNSDVAIGGWTANPDWDDILGEYPGLSSTTIGGSDIWGDGINSKPSTGGDSDPGNNGWGNEVNDDLNNDGNNPNNGWGGSSDTNPGDIGNIGGQGGI